MSRYFPAWRAPLLFVLSFFMCLQALVAKGTDPAPDAGRTVLLQQGSIVVDSIKPLTIGDRIPETLWNLPLKVVNHPEGKDTITLQEYRGKLIILDFWATWCSSCISAFPKVYDLNQKYAADMVIIPVNSDRREATDAKFVEDFLIRRNVVYHLPSILDHEQVLFRLSGHRTIPHYLWLQNDKLIAITKSDVLFNSDFPDVINGGGVPALSNEPIEWDTNHPLFHKGNGGQGPDSYIFRSFISSALPGLKRVVGNNMDNNAQISRIYAVNVSVHELFNMAYPEIKGYLQSRIVFEDQSANESARSWSFEDRVSYDLFCPPKSHQEAMMFMQQDIEKGFGWKPIVCELETACLVLRMGDGPSVMVSPDRRRITNIYEEISGPKYYRNGPLHALIRRLNQVANIPVLDETDFDQLVSLDLPEDLTDLDLLAKMMDSQGFKATFEKRKIDMVVFTKP